MSRCASVNSRPSTSSAALSCSFEMRGACFSAGRSCASASSARAPSLTIRVARVGVSPRRVRRLRSKVMRIRIPRRVVRNGTPVAAIELVAVFILKILTSVMLAAATCVSLLPTARGEITILAVTSSPTFAAGLPGPGSLASVFCTGLTGIQGVEVAQGTPLPRTLDGIRVTVGAIDAPILAVADFGSYQQINFQVPLEASTRPSLVLSPGAFSARMDNVLPSPFGGFFMDASGYAVVQHAVDFQLVTPDNPARPGEWLVAYASNLGPVTSPQLTGVPAPVDPLARIAPGSPGPWQFTVWLSQPSGFFTSESTFMGLTP